MKKISLLLLVVLAVIFISGKAFAQNSCLNADFSAGDFSNWTGSTSDTAGIVAGTPNSLPSTIGQHTLMNATGTDPNTNGVLSVIPPGGLSSCRLGNDLSKSCISTEPVWAKLKYEIPVTASNCIFSYQYAVVLQDTSGFNTSSTEFTVRVLDVNGNVVDPVCGIYEVNLADNLSEFNKCIPASGVCSSSDTVLWKDWSTVSTDLSPYIGQNITIEFTAYDAEQNFGYAYISCFCGSLEFAQECVGTSDILTAPAGFVTYSWSPSTGLSSTNNQQVTLVNSNAYSGNEYSCTCTSIQGCVTIVQANINPCPVGIIEADSNMIFNILPNISSGIVTIESGNKGSIEIIGMGGNLITSFGIDKTKTKINLSFLQSGIYIIRYVSDNGFVVKKFIKE